MFDRGGWVLWVGAVMLLVGLGIATLFVGMLIGSDEAFAARPFFLAGMLLLGSAALVFALGLARSITTLAARAHRPEGS